MAITFSLFLLLLLLLALTTAASAATHHHLPISATPTHAPSKPPSPPTDIPETHLDNIIDALIGAGDFAGWANLLSTVDPSSLPLTATFFIPANDAVSNFDGFLIAYHIVPQRLTFSDLQRLAIHTRLPTLLPAKFILITDNSPANFTVDGSRISHPDVFVNTAFTVHGVEKLLDYSVYGGGHVPSTPLSENKKSPRVRRRQPHKRGPASSGPGEANTISGGSCLCSWVLIVLSISYAVLDLLLTFS